MYKRFITGLLTITVLTIGPIFLPPEQASAATVTCTTEKVYVTTYSSYTSWENSTKHNETYSYPTSPTLNNTNVRDRSLNASDFSSTYTHSYYKKVFRQDYTYPVYYNYKVCGTSKTYTGTSYGGNTYGSSYHWYNNNYSSTYSSSISVTKTGGSTTSGSEVFTATATGMQGKKTSSSGHRSYYVDKVVVSVSDDKTYEDELYPSVTCQKTYGSKVGYNYTVNCKNDLSVNNDKSKTIRTICYHYTERGHKGEDCTKRVYVEKLEVTGPDKTYTGKHHQFGCNAIFYDGYKRNINGKSDTMSSAPYNYIGDAWLAKGWKEPDGTVHYPNSVNDFYPADNQNGTYTIKCTYYPNSYGDYTGYLAEDDVTQKTGSKNVQHIGIAGIDIDSSGYFSDGANEYKWVPKVNKTSDGKKVTGSTYITGHWYDFKATLRYNDGTTRDITSAPEVYWESTPWYNGVSPYNKLKAFDTNMTQSGLSHRIPVDGKNVISVEYFNRNVPHGGNSSASSNNSLKSRQTLDIDARQIKKIEIRDASGYNNAPKTNVKSGDKVGYSAWITWTDGVREDWTDAVTWSGEYSKGGGKFEFVHKGNNNKATVTAVYNDGDRGETTLDGNWDSTFSKLEVNITFDCKDATTLTFGCEVPKGNWQTEPYLFFESSNINFLPPPSAYGLDGTSWEEKGEYRSEYPYNFVYKFNVSGVSEGN